MAKSFLGQSNLPRGLRNNNPGNLVMTNIAWQGKIPNSQNTDGHFEQFTDIGWGLRAMMKDLINDYTKKGLNTVTKLISEFAPAFENNTTGYINTVSNIVGIGINQVITTLDKKLLIQISKAIVSVENGSQYAHYLDNSDYENAYNLTGFTGAGSKKKSDNRNTVNSCQCSCGSCMVNKKS